MERANNDDSAVTTRRSLSADVGLGERREAVAKAVAENLKSFGRLYPRPRQDATGATVLQGREHVTHQAAPPLISFLDLGQPNPYCPTLGEYGVCFVAYSNADHVGDSNRVDIAPSWVVPRRTLNVPDG